MKKHLLTTWLLSIMMVFGVGSAWAADPDLENDYTLVKSVTWGDGTNIAGSGACAHTAYDTGNKKQQSLTILTAPEDAAGWIAMQGWTDGSGKGWWNRADNSLYCVNGGRSAAVFGDDLTTGWLVVFECKSTASSAITLTNANGEPDGTFSYVASEDGKKYFCTITAAENAYVGFCGNKNAQGILKISVYKPNKAAVPTTYTVKYVDMNGNTLKADATYDAIVGATVSLSDADKANITIDGTTYVYDSDDSTDKTAAEEGATVVTVKFHAAANFSYTVNEVCGETIARATNATSYETANVKVGYRKYNAVNGQLYTKDATSKEYNYSFKLTQDNQVENISYSVVEGTTNVVFLAEGEDIEGLTPITTGNTAIRSSNSASAYAPADTKITTLAAGKYKIHAVIYDAASEPNSNWTFMAGPFEVAKFNCTTVNIAEFNSEEFVIGSETDLIILKAGSTARGLDAIYIQKTGDVTAEEIALAEAKAALQADINAAKAIDTTGKKLAESLANAITEAETQLNAAEATVENLQAAQMVLAKVVEAYYMENAKNIFVKPGVWNVDGARYAAYVWNDKGNTWFDFYGAEGDSIYTTQIPEYYSGLILVRLNGATVENNWDNKWNQTADIDFTAVADSTLFTITGWGEGSSPYETSKYEIPATPAEPIYIETDLTAQFNSLATTKWTGSSGQVGWAAPTVTTNSGLNVAAWERYNGSCDWTGEIMSSSVTGLTPGTYKIELYGAAAFTFGRGFGSTDFTGDFTKDTSENYTENDAITENTGVTLFAETSEGTVSKEIPIWYATNFNTSGIAIATLENVVVGDAGTIKIGLSKTSTSTNWHVVQLKGVTAQVDAVELHANELAAAKAALNAEENAVVTGEEKTALETAISENATVAEQTADAYKAAIKALSDATAAFTGAKAAYEGYAAAQAYLVDLPYADAAKKPAAEDATNAADATAKAEALMVALRAYYESYALAEGVEGAKNMTDSIKNPNAQDGINNWTVVLGEGSGGNVDVKSNEPWTDAAGVAEHKYFDGGNWGAQAWDVALEQKIALPAGKYLLTTIARAAGDVDFNLYAGADSVKLAAIGAAGGMFNRGWNNGSVEFELAEADSIVIGVRGVTEKQYNWMSFSDFRLMQLEEGAEPAELEKFYIMGDGTANAWNTTTEMTFNEKTQAFEYTVESENGAWIAFGDVEFTNWDDFNANHRYAIGNGDVNVTTFGEAMQLLKVNGTLALPAGKFNVSVTKELLCTITEVVVPTHTWDFTQWSEATVTNLKADAAASKLEGWSDVEKKADAEADVEPTEASKDNCFWATVVPDENGELAANGVLIDELKGLSFNPTYAGARSLAIAVNYPSTSLGDYAGPAYLWLGGGGKNVDCFVIKNVKAGTQISMGVETHKIGDARGIQLFVEGAEGARGNKLVAPDGNEVAAPTAYTEQTWAVPGEEGVCNIIVYNTKGCHIYFIDAEIGETAETIESMYIMGDFTGGWEFDDTQKMTQDVENTAIWTLTVEGFEAEAKTYYYKATANQKWGVYELPGAGEDANNNFVFGTDEYPAGKYNLLFTVNTDENTLTLVATKIGGTEGITMLKAAIENGTVYNMNGQKVNKAQKGLYIINGKKVVIK